MAFSRSLTITCARDNWTESENWAGWAGTWGKNWLRANRESYSSPDLLAQTFPSANLTLQLRDLELAPEMRNFRPSAQLQSHLGEATWSRGLSWRINLGFCLFSRLRKPLWGVCWVEPLTRWASEGPYKACGQIPEVPWNWHFVWIGVKSSVCPPSALSTQTKRGALIMS